MSEPKKIALVLTGGGARGAYQVGAVKALYELFGDDRFSILVGLSAGAINAVHMASFAHEKGVGIEKLSQLWGNLSSDQIYSSSVLSIGAIGAKWVSDILMGSMEKKKRAQSLLDTAPLYDLLVKSINFDKLIENTNNGKVSALSISAFNYSTNKSISFVQGNHFTDWHRIRRMSQKAEITAKHVLASCSIPLVFPSVEIEGDFFGDATLRNSAPLSSVIHLGAEKVLLIGVRGKDLSTQKLVGRPSVARIFGYILNSLFFDATDTDMERLEAINALVESVDTENLPLKKIEVSRIRPSVDLGGLASSIQTAHLPGIVNYLLSGLGDKNESSELASYLLFESAYTQKLIELGYDDVKSRREDLAKFLDA